MEFIYVIVIVREMVEEVQRFARAQAVEAEQAFVGCMADRIHNFEEYSVGDVEACVEDGYEGFGQGNSIQLHWADG